VARKKIVPMKYIAGTRRPVVDENYVVYAAPQLKGGNFYRRSEAIFDCMILSFNLKDEVIYLETGLGLRKWNIVFGILSRSIPEH